MADTNTERIGKLERSIDTLADRVDNHRQFVERIETDFAEIAKLLQEVDKRLALAARDVDRLEKKLDELLSRRWELWKLVLAAFLGSILTVAASFAGRSLDRLIGAAPSPVRPAAPAPGRGR